MNLSSNPLFKQADSALNSHRKVTVHVPLNQLTAAQQAEYLRRKFGLYHGSGKKKRKSKR